MPGNASHQADRAKAFLRDRILLAAAANDTALSAAEVRMLTYSEPDATAEDHVANGLAGEWKASLRALRGEDLYVLVMSFDMVCFVALGAAGFAFFVTGIGVDVIPSDAVRVVLFVVWIAAVWTVGEWSRRRIGGR